MSSSMASFFAASLCGAHCYARTHHINEKGYLFLFGLALAGYALLQFPNQRRTQFLAVTSGFLIGVSSMFSLDFLAEKISAQTTLSNHI